MSNSAFQLKHPNICPIKVNMPCSIDASELNWFNSKRLEEAFNQEDCKENWHFAHDHMKHAAQHVGLETIKVSENALALAGTHK